MHLIKRETEHSCLDNQVYPGNSFTGVNFARSHVCAIGKITDLSQETVSTEFSPGCGSPELPAVREQEGQEIVFKTSIYNG